MAKKHTISEQGEVVILQLSGKIMGGPDDTPIVKMIYDLADEGKVKVVIDFCNVEWMNSRGLGICIAGATTLRNRGGDLKLACTSGKVKMLLEKTRMFAIFEDFSDVEEAIKSFG
jgi:anti-sigma B factor antagonist